MESARTFTVRLHELLRCERSSLAEFIVALAELDRRRLWLDLGHASLFSYLHRELGLSKGAAFYRKTAAELVQRFPEVLEPLRDGRLCFTSVVELARVLTPENRDEVLPRFFLLSKREAKEVSAEIRPVEASPRRDVVTVARVPAAAPTLTLGGAALVLRPVTVHPDEPAPDLRQAAVRLDEPLRASTTAPTSSGAQRAAATPSEAHRRAVTRPNLAPPASPSRATVDPLTADANRLHITVSRRFLRKLEAARAALSHSHPGAGMEETLEAGLDLLLDRHARRKGLVKRPRSEPRPSKPGHVPAHVLRAVWERDGGRCQWKLQSGGVCGSTLRVEVDHAVAKARGGPPTVENLRCLCRTHNDLAARQAFGDAWMDRYTHRPRDGERRDRRRTHAPPTADAPPSPPP